MTKDKQENQPEQLSEWQKRNKEYLEKKALEEAEEQRQQAEKQKERQEQLQHGASDEEAAEQGDQQAESELDADERADIDPEEMEAVPENPEDSEAAAEAEELSEKERKKLAKLQKKAEQQAEKVPIQRVHIYRALPVLLISSLLLLVSLYFLTPLATMKEIEISGNRLVSEETLLESGKIDSRDYTLTTFINQANHIRNFKAASPWIEQVKMSYQFPITFKVDVKEYEVLAYLHENDSYYPILTNGEVIEEAVAEASLPESRLTVEFSDRALIKEFAEQLKSVPDSVKGAIERVQLTPSRVTQDLATLTMTDGNKILVPISHIAKKLPYYRGIRSQLESPSVVDMEAGIFSYQEGAENEPKSPESSDTAESTENQENQEGTEEQSSEQGQTEETNPSENPEITENN